MASQVTLTIQDTGLHRGAVGWMRGQGAVLRVSGSSFHMSPFVTVPTAAILLCWLCFRTKFHRSTGYLITCCHKLTRKPKPFIPRSWFVAYDCFFWGEFYSGSDPAARKIPETCSAIQGLGLGVMWLEETIQSELARAEREHREREPKTVRLKLAFLRKRVHGFKVYGHRTPMLVVVSNETSHCSPPPPTTTAPCTAADEDTEDDC